MTQSRYVNYGAPVDAEKIKAITMNTISAGLLSGGTLTVYLGENIQVSPLALALGDGIVLVEDATQTILKSAIETAISPTPVFGPNAWSATIYMSHTDMTLIGGNPATLNVINGIYTSIASSTIIGWILYPGGSVGALSSDMLYAATARRFNSLASPAESTFQLAPFGYNSATGTSEYLSIGSDLTPTSTFDYGKSCLELVAGAGANTGILFLLPFAVPAGFVPPRLYEICYRMVIGATPPTISLLILFDSYGNWLQPPPLTGLSAPRTVAHPTYTDLYKTKVRIYPETFNFEAGNTLSIVHDLTFTTGDTAEIYWSRVSICDTPESWE